MPDLEDEDTEELVDRASELKESIENQKIEFKNIVYELYDRDELPDWMNEYMKSDLHYA